MNRFLAALNDHGPPNFSKVSFVAAGTVRNSNKSRLYILGGFLVFWCLAICVRLAYLQIFCYGEFEQRAQHQQQRTIDVSAKRGIIYDRNGRELAMSISVDSIFAVPTEIPHLAQTIALVTRVTRQDPHEILARCEASKSFCWIQRKADADVSQRVRALNLRGIHFQKESKRFYPKRDLAAQVLGYVGMDDEGLSGIEREYNDQLEGKAGRMLISVDARRKWFGSVEKQPEPGENVVLTIDQQIQYIAEHELETAMEQTGAISGTVVVENPHTGEILALANRPTFNPNVAREITSAKLRDHAVSDVYEPGSTFKLVTLSAALDEKLTNPDEVFDCQMGSIVINGMRIHDHKAYGLLTVSKILADSSDVGAIKVALRLGDDRFYQYIHAYGFGQKTGIELPAETRGLAKPVSRWSKVSIGAMAMGQEIGITPLQLIAMVSTIANDGVRVAPRIVAATLSPQSSVQTIAFHPQDESRVISPLTAAEMKRMMQGVVLEGTGKRAILDGYSSAGKTGTAQKIDPATHAYSHTKYVASFAGFAPVNNPAITVAVVLDSPSKGSHEGGMAAAPVFQRVAQQVLEYLHVPHDVPLPESRRLLLAESRVKPQDLEEGSPDHLGGPLDISNADTDSDSLASTTAPARHNASAPATDIVPASLREPVASPASVQSSLSAASDPLATRQTADSPTRGTVVLDVEQGGIVVPSFVGKSMRDAIEAAESAGLDLDAVGNGVAMDQSPPAGSHVAAGSQITVKFGR